MAVMASSGLELCGRLERPSLGNSGAPSDSAEKKHGVCSWCLLTAGHVNVQEKQWFGRNAYSCEVCLRQTRPCASADCGNFAKMGAFGDILCVVCAAVDRASHASATARTEVALAVGKAALASHPFESTFPPRADTPVRVLIDGWAFFHAVRALLEEASHHVYLSFWALSPHLELPCGPTPDSASTVRLSELLRSAASRGVRIFALLWDETVMRYS